MHIVLGRFNIVFGSNRLETAYYKDKKGNNCHFWNGLVYSMQPNVW